jgi:Uma2 family endonuclease
MEASMETQPCATIEDLYRVPEHGKAEIVNGKLVLMSPTGAKPGRAGLKIVLSLDRYEEEHGGGYALPDNVGFVVNLPHRKSFSPDVAWHVGDVDSMKFVSGAPVFAVEVRSENDYSPQAEEEISAKIQDYFAAGTQVVWDVDLLGPDTIRVYRASDPDHPTIYRRGDVAEAEPAVPGWTFNVDKLFRR